MTFCKVASQFPTSIWNINAWYKSVSLEMKGVNWQCDLPGLLLLMSWVIYSCWGSRSFGKSIYCELTSLPAVEACLNFLLVSFLAGVRVGWLPHRCIGSSLGDGPVGLKKAWWYTHRDKLGIWTSECRSFGWTLRFLSNWIHWVIKSGTLSNVRTTYFILNVVS